MPQNKKQRLASELAYHLKSGSSQMKIGFHAAPEGYAIMIDADRTMFYWLRYDGMTSTPCCDKWATYRGAIEDVKLNEGQTQEEK